MEPIIYKPGAYNTPGIYKGAGGIYNGRGVYNDGAGYNGPFILLNNCDNLEDNICNSLIGDDLFNNNYSSFGYLVNSDTFTGSKSIRRTNSTYIFIDNIYPKDVFTIEFYISNLPSIDNSDVYCLDCFCMAQYQSGGLVIGCEYANDFYTDYPVIDWTSTYKAILLNTITKGHFAAVVNKKTKRVTAFLNGVFVCSYTYNNLNSHISQNGSSSDSVVEFFSVRNGDFSNNLNSFDVPTQKYSL